ncbi:unnamed protein product [Sphagnum tenellum]
MAYAASTNQFINEITPAFYWQNSKAINQTSPSLTRRAWTNLFKQRMPAMGLKSAYTKLAPPPSPLNKHPGNFTSDTGLTFNETHPTINSRGLSPLNKKFPYTPAGTHQHQRKREEEHIFIIPIDPNVAWAYEIYPDLRTGVYQLDPAYSVKAANRWALRFIEPSYYERMARAIKYRCREKRREKSTTLSDINMHEGRMPEAWTIIYMMHKEQRIRALDPFLSVMEICIIRMAQTERSCDKPRQRVYRDHQEEHAPPLPPRNRTIGASATSLTTQIEYIHKYLPPTPPRSRASSRGRRTGMLPQRRQQAYQRTQSQPAIPQNDMLANELTSTNTANGRTPQQWTPPARTASSYTGSSMWNIPDQIWYLNP